MQNNTYTDQEMIWAAQLSYIDFTDDEVQEWYSNHNKTYPTVRELLLQRAAKSNRETIEYLTIDDPRREDIYRAYYQGNNMIERGRDNEYEIITFRASSRNRWRSYSNATINAPIR